MQASSSSSPPWTPIASRRCRWQWSRSACRRPWAGRPGRRAGWRGRTGRRTCRSARTGWSRCVSILLDKNRRYIGKSQSQRPPKRTQRPPHLGGAGAAGRLQHALGLGGGAGGDIGGAGGGGGAARRAEVALDASDLDLRAGAGRAEPSVPARVSRVRDGWTSRTTPAALHGSRRRRQRRHACSAGAHMYRQSRYLLLVGLAGARVGVAVVAGGGGRRRAGRRRGAVGVGADGGGGDGVARRALGAGEVIQLRALREEVVRLAQQRADCGRHRRSQRHRPHARSSTRLSAPTKLRCKADHLN
jgi:hypothetical protein